MGSKTRRFGVFILTVCLSTCPVSAVSDDRHDFGRPAVLFSCTKPVAATLRSIPIADSGGGDDNDDARVQHGVRSQAPSHGSRPRNGADQDVHLLIDP